MLQASSAIYRTLPRVLLVLLTLTNIGQTQDRIAGLDGLRTVAESSDFKATATGDDVANFLNTVVKSWPRATLKSIGDTTEGRKIWAVIVPPKEKSDAKPITVLMLGGIHPGECDGKEALLALARDMALGKTPAAWDKLRLIMVPNFNADGNERKSKLHRPEQNGPEDGVGIRENAQGLDLNRDFIKLETPEVRSLVAALSEYDVDVLLDLHTTNGSLHRFELTYDIPHNPAAPAAIDQWLRGNLLPNATEKMLKSGFQTFFYGNFNSDYTKWETYGHEGRYSTEYMALRGRIGILVESYSYATYKRRIEGSYTFVTHLLNEFAAQASDIRNLITQASQRAQPGEMLALSGKLALTQESVLVPSYKTAEDKTPSGPYNANSAANLLPKDYLVQLWNRVEATKQTALPVAYAVPSEYAWAVSRLPSHGIQIQRLTADAKIDGQQIKVEKLERAGGAGMARRGRPGGGSFQGHSLLKLETSYQDASVNLPQGTYIVSTSQPLGWLAAYLLEPASDDSLASWNFFDPDLAEGKLAPVVRLNRLPESGSLVTVDRATAGEQLSLERLVGPGATVEYSGPMLRPVSWLKDRSEYVVRRDEGTFAVDAATGGMRPLDELRKLTEVVAATDGIGPEAQRDVGVNSFTKDMKYAVISGREDTFVYDSATGKMKTVADARYAELSPDGSHIAFIRGNNLWVMKTEDGSFKQLTKDGSNELLNGVLDWVYQEELYGRGRFKAFWWSPDSQHISLLQLDQSAVLHYQVSDSTTVEQRLEDTRYPKAGAPIPTARVWIADVASAELRQVDLSGFPESDRLVARVSWSPDNAVWLQVFNRIQNNQSVVRVDPRTGTAKTILSESTPGWIEVLGTPEFLPNGDFLWLSDLPEGRRHLYRVNANTGEKMALTSGAWDVSSLQSISEDKRTAFVLGSMNHPTESHLIGVDIDRGGTRQITREPGTHRCQPDGSGKYYIDSFSSHGKPPRISLHSIDGQLIRILATTISDRYAYVNIRPPQQLTITARDGVELQALLMLPPNIDPTKPDRKLPVLFHVYGGPQAPTVQNAWAGPSYWWHQMLCQQGFAVMLCDNRSARGRGIKDTWTIRGDLGGSNCRTWKMRSNGSTSSPGRIRKKSACGDGATEVTSRRMHSPIANCSKRASPALL